MGRLWINRWNITNFFIYTLFKQLTYRSDRSPHFYAQWLKWCGLTQGCAFSGFGWYCSPFRGSNYPKTSILGAWIGIFKPNASNIETFILLKNYCIDHNQILQSDRDPKYLLWVVQIYPQTNPKWRTAAILKNRKILISSQPIDRFWQNLACWCTSTLSTPLADKISRFHKSKIMAEAI